MAKQLKQSETRIIRRSEINLNPVNPKRHTSESVKLQKKNLQKVGFLGGIVWNEVSHNLIDGHRRIMAMDLHYKYDGTPEKDYEVKVEVVHLEEKEEKEQLTYMAVGNTKADIDLIAGYINDIDYSNVGLTTDQLNDILATANAGAVEVPDVLGDLITPTEPEQPATEEQKPSTPQKTTAEKIAHVKDIKQKTAEMAEERAKQESAYITLSFTEYDTYLDFCEMMGLQEGAKFAKGEDILAKIE